MKKLIIVLTLFTACRKQPDIIIKEVPVITQSPSLLGRWCTAIDTLRIGADSIQERSQAPYRYLANSSTIFWHLDDGVFPRFYYTLSKTLDTLYITPALGTVVKPLEYRRF